MNRRGFLGMIVGGVAASAAVRTWPFRVFSFPAELVIPELSDVDQCIAIELEAVSAHIPILYKADETFLNQLRSPYSDDYPGRLAAPYVTHDGGPFTQLSMADLKKFRDMATVLYPSI